MPRASRNASQRLTAQALELSLAVPQVVTKRLTQMASAGLNPSASDREEFLLMGHEKVVAFYESWAAMWLQNWRTQAEIAQNLAASSIGMVFGARPRPVDWYSRMPADHIKLLSAGLKPVHGKAVANAKRLAKRKAK